jgi:hypothetical protein
MGKGALPGRAFPIPQQPRHFSSRSDSACTSSPHFLTILPGTFRNKQIVTVEYFSLFNSV